MIDRPILFSVAHSSKAKGAQSHDAMLSEYWVSLRATLAAVRNLAGEYPVEMLDVGPLMPNEYDDAKLAAVNRCMPALAIEIHCNASTDPLVSYGEVIHHRNSQPGAFAAAYIAQAIAEGFASSNHKHWRSRGARPNTAEYDDHKMFFIELTKCPAVIVEGLFISNMEQAAWLAGEGGCEAYGLLVAAGIRRWIGARSDV